MNFLNLTITIKNNYLNQLVKFLGKNKLFNNIVSKYADQGLSI